MRASLLIFISLLISGTSFAQNNDPQSLASAVEFLNYRWQLELSSIENFKKQWLILERSQEFKDCQEQDGSLWKWLSYDKCQRHRKEMRTELLKLFKLNREATKKYDMYVNNIKDDQVRTSKPVQKSRDLNYKVYLKTQESINRCLVRTDEIYETEYNYKNNLEYFEAGTESIDCYYNWSFGYAQIISGLQN